MLWSIKTRTYNPPPKQALVSVATSTIVLDTHEFGNWEIGNGWGDRNELVLGMSQTEVNTGSPMCLGYL